VWEWGDANKKPGLRVRDKPGLVKKIRRSNTLDTLSLAGRQDTVVMLLSGVPIHNGKDSG
jgi:hypothetical protein